MHHGVCWPSLMYDLSLGRLGRPCGAAQEPRHRRTSAVCCMCSACSSQSRPALRDARFMTAFAPSFITPNTGLVWIIQLTTLDISLSPAGWCVMDIRQTRQLAYEGLIKAGRLFGHSLMKQPNPAGKRMQQYGIGSCCTATCCSSSLLQSEAAAAAGNSMEHQITFASFTVAPVQSGCVFSLAAVDVALTAAVGVRAGRPPLHRRMGSLQVLTAKCACALIRACCGT
jgi:hypothetical protein